MGEVAEIDAITEQRMQSVSGPAVALPPPYVAATPAAPPRQPSPEPDTTTEDLIAALMRLEVPSSAPGAPRGPPASVDQPAASPQAAAVLLPSASPEVPEMRSPCPLRVLLLI